MPSTLLVVPRDGGAALRLPVFDRPVQPDWPDSPPARATRSWPA